MKAIVAMNVSTRCLVMTLITLLVGCGDSSLNSVVTPTETTSMTRPRGPLQPPETPDVAEATPVKISDKQNLPGLSDEDAAAITYPPVVALSDLHRSSCKCALDDTFPALQLKTLEGAETSLAAHMGKRLTVVVFWNLEFPAGIEQISRLNTEVIQRFDKIGLNVVCINVGDAIEDIQSFLGQVECDAIHLQDVDGSAFAQVATEFLPRTYLLDAYGTIQWFDLEYSRSTRRELRNAIIYSFKRQLDGDGRG
jgi:hypothetical protein